MDVHSVIVEHYRDQNGRVPFEDWFESLYDHRAQEIILARLGRIKNGLYGDVKGLEEGIFEIRIHFGPGYRIYFGKHNHQIILLLCASDKRRQNSAIQKAKRYWKDYLRRVLK